MPNPNYSDVHVNTPLTNISIGWAQANAGKYHTAQIFPTVGVMKKSDKYYTYDQGDLQRSQARRRAPGALVELGGYRLSTDDYSCDRWALGMPISDPERSNADPQLNLDADATEFLTDQIELAKEVEWTGSFFTTSIWTGASSTGDMSGSAAPASTASSFLYWSDQASTPIEDLRGELTTVAGRGGFPPNKLVLGQHVWDALADHVDLLDRVKYTQGGVFGPELLASLLGLNEVVVLNAVYNSAQEEAADSIGFVAGKHALLLYVTPAPGLKRPTAGYSFVWTGNGSPTMGARMKSYRDEPHEGDMIEAETWVDFKQVSASLGAFFSGAVA